MRLIVLLSLLALTACTIREETFAPSDEAPSALSLGPANPNIPTGEDADSACRGNFARGSRVDQYRDGAASLFCD
jgi:hypothetical protein